MEEFEIVGVDTQAYRTIQSEGGKKVHGVSWMLVGEPPEDAAPGRFLGRYVRERKVITLENAIRKMCYLPAMVYGMSTKGLIREGMDADLVLFDPETVCDNNDYANPYAKNSGLDYVIVGGEIAVRDNVATGALGGKQLRKTVD